MAKVNIEVPSTLNAQDTYAKIKRYFENPTDLKKYDPQMACTFNDANMTGAARGGKFNADLKVSTLSGQSSVSLVLDLPLLLTPFKSQIKNTIEKKLNALLA